MLKLTPMFKLKPLVIATSLATPFLLAGCNSSDSGSSSPSDISGQVIGSDGYYMSATVCSDQNMDYVCNAGEPMVTTDEKGQFSKLAYLPGKPIIAEASSGLLLYAMPSMTDYEGRLNISPLSTATVARMKVYDVPVNIANTMTSQSLRIGQRTLALNFLDDTGLSAEQQEQMKADAFTRTERLIQAYNDAEGTVNFPYFLELSGESENPWKDAAIDWTVDSGLDFLSDGVFSLFGLGDKDATSKELNQIASDLDSINDQLQAVNAQLQTLNADVFQILNTILTNAVNSDKKQFSQISDDITSYWQNVQYNTGLGTDNSQSLADLLADNDALSGLKNGNTQYGGAMSNLNTLSKYATNLSGEDTFISTYLADFTNIRDTNFSAIKQGTKGSDMVGYLEASNENLIAQYVVIMNNLQAIYQMEYLALYLHANADKITDAELSKWYASLEVYEPNITKDNTLSENLTNLNTAYYNKFGQLQKLILGALVSDSPHNGYPKDINGNEISMTSAKGYKETAPKGSWQDSFNLYVWQGLISAKHDANGYYDGVTLITPDSKYPQWKPKLDLSNCLWPETDTPNGYKWTVSGTTYFRINCGTLKADNYKIKETGSVFSMIDYVGDVDDPSSNSAIYKWSKGVDHSDSQHIEFSQNFVTFYQGDKYTYNGDWTADKSIVLDKNNKFITPPGGAVNQVIQVTLEDNTSALFQISLFNPSMEHKALALICGFAEGSGGKHGGDKTLFLNAEATYGDQHWKCEGPYISNHYGSRLDITTQTGKKYSIIAGMQGKNIYDNEKDNLNMDVCEYGDDACADKLNYHNPFDWSKAEDAY